MPPLPWLGLVASGPAGALILGPAIGAAALLGNNTLKGYAEEKLMTDWSIGLQRAAEGLHESIITALEHRVARLEERSGEFARNSSRSEIDTWLAGRARDDLIAALEDRANPITSRPKAEVDAIKLLFNARDIAPANAAVLLQIHKVEQTISRKPDLKAAMVEVGRPVGDLLRARLNRQGPNCRPPKEREGD